MSVSQPDPASSVDAARALIRALVAGGLRTLVISPGSRSAPLVYAGEEARARGELQIIVCLDERSAAFRALGCTMADPTSPAAVATTSGTAPAHLHPAVLEASHANLPLVLLTADRPPELHGVGAHQTTEQGDLFGKAVRLARTVGRGVAGEPVHVGREESADAELGDWVGAGLDEWVNAGLLAMETALGVSSGWPGPVHLNLQFREPLVPSTKGSAYPPQSAVADCGPHGSVPPTRNAVSQPHRNPTLLRPGPPTLVIAGAGAGPEARILAEQARWPLLAEPSSGSWGGPNAIAAYTRVLADTSGLAAASPDATPIPRAVPVSAAASAADPATPLSSQVRRVIVFGRPTLSRPTQALLASESVETVIVHPHPGPWFDVGDCATRVVDAVTAQPEPDGAWLGQWRSAGFAHLAAALVEGPAERAAEPAHPSADADSAAAGALLKPGDLPLTGPLTAAFVAQACAADGAPLFVAASQAIRHLDLLPGPIALDVLSDAAPHDVRTLGAQTAPTFQQLPPGPVYSMRGLSGIDGTLSAAWGLALAKGTPVRVLAGDLAFFHDASGLAHGAHEACPDLDVIVLNDRGGGLFRTLDHARAATPAVFSRYFLTPQTSSIARLAKANQARHRKVRTMTDLAIALTPPPLGVRVIEVVLG